MQENLKADGDLRGIAREICARHRNEPAQLIEILHDVQDALGAIPSHVVLAIADALNLSRAEVHGVVSFYHDFRQTPAGAHVIKICRSESCQAMGGAMLGPRAEYALGCRFGETTADGRVTLEAVYCLGNCALSPAVMIDGNVHGRVDAKRFDELLERLRPEAAL
jgi:formate dehydrogenase subunit gamma